MAFTKVKDNRGHDIRGLWERNGRFYAQLRVPGRASPAKVPLRNADGNPAKTPAEAKVALQELQKQRRENNLPVLKQAPTLSEWIEHYLQFLRRAEAKHEKTIGKEAHHLERWRRCLGGIRLADLRPAHINQFVVWRREQSEIGNRTINLDVIALNNCLNHAIREGRLHRLPTENWTPLAHVSPKRPLWSDAQIEAVCRAAREHGENGDLLADYVRFMAYSGCRRNEALNVAWNDINWERRIVAVRETKYGHPREVDFNARLKAHLNDMQTRKVSAWLFPSPMDPEQHAENLQGSLETAREAAGLPELQFHDLRHFFISQAVMSGIDYMTIARWVGHKDGGILIGKVYGHLNDAHAKKQADKLFAGQVAPAADPDALQKILQQALAQLQSQKAA